MNALVLRSAIVAALGGLLFGFDTAVISGTTQQLTRFYELSPGGLGLHRGDRADRHHRRRAGRRQTGRPLRAQEGALRDRCPVPRRGAGYGPSCSNLALFQIFRFLGGIGVGVASVVAPIYTAEIAPPTYRGRLVGLVQFNIVLGILLAYLSNFIIAASLLPAEIAWRWMFVVMAFPRRSSSCCCSPSPRRRAGCSRWAAATRPSPGRTGTTSSKDEAEFEIREIEEALAAQHGQRQVAVLHAPEPQGHPAGRRDRRRSTSSRGSTRSSTTRPTSSGRPARATTPRPWRASSSAWST